MTFIKRVFRDVKARVNLEAYIVALIASGLLVIDIIGDVDDSLKLTVIVAALLVLVLRSTAPSTTTTANLDTVLRDRSAQGPLREFIGTGKTLYAYGPSAINVLAKIGEVRNQLIEKNGMCRIIIQHPDITPDFGALKHHPDFATIETDIQSSLTKLRRFKVDWYGHLEYRLTEYTSGFSMLIVDPDKKDGRMVIEFFGYQNEDIHQRMHIVIHRSESEKWFEYWLGQFNLMWEQSTLDPIVTKAEISSST